MKLILKLSKIHGVGVFAIKPIKINSEIPLFQKTDWKIIKKPYGLARRYCTKCEYGNYYYRPEDWHRMSIGWYLNHSVNPNVNAKSFKSIKYIKAGQELTIDYNNL